MGSSSKRFGAAAVLVALPLWASCQGEIAGGGGEPGSGSASPGSSASGSGSGAGRGGTTGSPSGGTASALCSVTPQRMWRLTASQLRRSFDAALGPGAAGASFESSVAALAPKGASLYTNNEPVLTGTPGFYEQVWNGAQTAATSAKPAQLAPCFAQGITATCVSTFIGDFGARLWRRPLTTDESKQLLAFWNGLVAAKASPETALAYTLRRLLVAPDALFRSEIGAKSRDGLFELTPYELASAVAYTITDGPPDALLLADAKAGKLDAATVDKHARRLLDTAAAAQGLFLFFADYLGVAPADADAREELRRFVEQVLWKSDAHLDELLTAGYTFANGANGWAQVTPPEGRAGLLTMRAVLSVERNRSARGKFIRERFLCEPPVSVPANVNTDVASQRAELEKQAGHVLNEEELRLQHMKNPACSGCHMLIDPIGQPLHVFDDKGMFRTKTASGLPIVRTGALNKTEDADGPVTDFVDLGRKLAGSRQVQRCFVAQAFQFTNGRVLQDEDQCVVDAFTDKFAKSGGNVRQLFVDLVTSDHFRFRKAAQ